MVANGHSAHAWRLLRLLRSPVPARTLLAAVGAGGARDAGPAGVWGGVAGLGLGGPQRRVQEAVRSAGGGGERRGRPADGRDPLRWRLP